MHPPADPPNAPPPVPPELREALGEAYELAQRLAAALGAIRANTASDSRIESWLTAQKDMLEGTAHDVFGRWVAGTLGTDGAVETLRAAVQAARESQPLD
jgi:hypothetical protein